MARPTKVEISEAIDGADLRLSVEGEIDLVTAPLVAQHVDQRMGASVTSLTLDLSELRFMDSSGLRLLIELNDRAQLEGWRLSLIASNHEPANLVLRMTGADTVLPFDGHPPS